MRLFSPLLAALACTACQHTPGPSAQDEFFARLQALCDQTFPGGLASPPTEADAAFAGPITVRVEGCTESEVRMPVAVGPDASRTWVVTRTPGALTLKHVHRHEDGSEDVLSRYGGTTTGPGRPDRQEFPADAFSRSLFLRENIPASVANVWALELRPGEHLAYELNRPGRHFRLQFDLTRPAGTR